MIIFSCKQATNHLCLNWHLSLFLCVCFNLTEIWQRILLMNKGSQTVASLTHQREYYNFQPCLSSVKKHISYLLPWSWLPSHLKSQELNIIIRIYLPTNLFSESSAGLGGSIYLLSDGPVHRSNWDDSAIGTKPLSSCSMPAWLCFHGVRAGWEQIQVRKCFLKFLLVSYVPKFLWPEQVTRLRLVLM